MFDNGKGLSTAWGGDRAVMTSHDQYVDHRGNPKPIFAYFSKKSFFLGGGGFFHFVKKKKNTPLRREYSLNCHNSFIQLALEEFQTVAKTRDDTQVQS